MATLSASTNGRTVNWTISNLSNKFDSRYYISAGICLTPFSDGAASISDILDTKAAVEYSPAVYSYSLLYQNAVAFTSSISGYTNYSFNSATGLFSNAGSSISRNPGDSGTTIYLAAGDELVERWTDDDLYIESIYASFLATPAVEGSTTTSDSYGSAAYGTYTIYAWAKANNGLYYNAGSFEITVSDNVIVKIVETTGGNFETYIPYVCNSNGDWEPYSAKIADGTHF